ncbi:excisionase [Aminicella lysinilytica]|uniref:Excisionase family DNA binding protein n=1 Tax=Aminicella lysinilytica TaxID=433323 RepID=A0A4R6PX73_9FIRM|nr:excisionase [Aminicella lysinilytica]TDP45158.1 excisionase family DNA binding protein [Aminicella lysinilytica]
MNKKKDIPIWHKTNLSIEEAIIYTGIGRNKLYELTSKDDCPFVLWVGNKRLVKRVAFDEYVLKRNMI